MVAWIALFTESVVQLIAETERPSSTAFSVVLYGLGPVIFGSAVLFGLWNLYDFTPRA